MTLLGSVAVAGVAELEIQQQLLSKWGKSIEGWFSERLSNIKPAEPTEGEPVTLTHITFPFTYVWGQVSWGVSSAWPYVTAIYEQIKTSIKDIWEGIKNFFKSLVEPEIFKNIFKDLHLKIWRVILFVFASGNGRDRFAKLFGSEKKQTTQIAAKFLLGMEHEGNKYFKADKNVFTFLLLQWMFNPKRVTEKFDRLSKTIDNLLKKAKDHDSKNSQKSQEEHKEDHTYILKVPTVKQYLEVEEGIPEILFNMMWTGEVASKIKTGYDLTGESKSWVSWFFKSSD